MIVYDYTYFLIKINSVLESMIHIPFSLTKKFKEQLLKDPDSTQKVYVPLILFNIFKRGKTPSWAISDVS